jgi:hypothetical protein
VSAIQLYDVVFKDRYGQTKTWSYSARNPDSARVKAKGNRDVAIILHIHKADTSRVPYGITRVRPFEQFVISITKEHGLYLDYPEEAKQIMRHPKDDAYGEYKRKDTLQDK